MREDLPVRLAAKLKEVKAATRGIDHLLVDAAAAGLLRPAPEVPKLTDREEIVLEMVALGLTNRQIAERLELSPHTVKDHCSSIYRRLQATNRASAIMRARELGLL